MTAYSFQKEFIQPIRTGIKTHTIRSDRKRHARPGEIVQLYYAMRTKHCALIGTGTCFYVTPVQLVFRENRVILGEAVFEGLHKLDTFAHSDGFAGWPEMREFWREKHGTGPFSGVLIKWIEYKDAIDG